jgi:hypothetical protein
MACNAIAEHVNLDPNETRLFNQETQSRNTGLIHPEA